MFDIDLVYLWCNGKDKNFIERKKNTLIINYTIQMSMVRKDFLITMN